MDWRLFENNPLFAGVEKERIADMLECLGSENKEFPKGSYIYRTGDNIHALGVVISGSVNLIKEDIWGNTQILDHIKAGQIFGETYACLSEEPLALNVQAAEKTVIFFLDLDKLLKPGAGDCPFHNRLIRNLLTVTASKNLNLTRKMDLLTQKSIRERVMIYLGSQAMKQNNVEFDIPFNRQQMADYLSVERSALSKELSKLREDGYIRFRKNHFIVNQK